jgi:predicted ATPase
MRGLAVLVALFQRLVETPVNLVGLEEPEIALHPAAAGVLFDAMREASQSVQVIATTHSADLLDKKEIDTDAILAVEMQRGTTRIGGINETGRVAVKEQLYSASELMRMNYLRPHVENEIESDLFGDLVTA